MREFCRELGVEPEIRTGAAEGYRVRARLSVRGGRFGARIGIFEEGSHRLVDIPECVVHHPLVNRVARAVSRCLRATNTSAYRESEHRGLVRALQVVVERASRSAQVTIVQNSDRFEDSAALCAALKSELGSELHSLFLNAQPRSTNTILGTRWHPVSGPAATVERLGGARVFFPPGAFGQANLDLFERVLAELHEQVPDGQRVLEFHAGTGAIGLGQVARSASYAFNEIGQDSLAGLELGLRALPPLSFQKTTLLPGNAGSFAARAADADVVVVDPPRKGLEPELIDALCERRPGPHTLLYLSCDFSSLMRDHARLAARFRAARVIGYALFPYTNHLETLVRYEQ